MKSMKHGIRTVSTRVHSIRDFHIKFGILLFCRTPIKCKFYVQRVKVTPIQWHAIRIANTALTKTPTHHCIERSSATM